MKTKIAIKKRDGFVYLLIFATNKDDNAPQEIGKVFAGTENAVPRGTGKQLLKRVSAHGPFIHSPKGKDDLITVPAKTAEVIRASQTR